MYVCVLGGGGGVVHKRLWIIEVAFALVCVCVCVCVRASELGNNSTHHPRPHLQGGHCLWVVQVQLSILARTVVVLACMSVRVCAYECTCVCACVHVCMSSMQSHYARVRKDSTSRRSAFS